MLDHRGDLLMSTADYVLLIHLFDQQIQKKGDPVEYRRHRKGAIVALSDIEAARLLKAKAIAPVAADEDGNTAVTPSNPAEPTDAAGNPPAPAPAPAQATGQRPVQTALKPEWEAYGVENGLDPEEVKALSKAEIAAAVDARQ